jgi:hypothetical protein
MTRWTDVAQLFEEAGQKLRPNAKVLDDPETGEIVIRIVNPAPPKLGGPTWISDNVREVRAGKHWHKPSQEL